MCLTSRHPNEYATTCFAQVVELVDTTDLGSVTHKVCRFESYPGQKNSQMGVFFCPGSEPTVWLMLEQEVGS